jgi:drug/metabolite transporter (DMT)-like permease
MVLIGILSGIGAAFFQSCSYFFSRRFLLQCGTSPRALFGVSHAQMGVAALLLLPLVLDRPLPPFSEFAIHLTACAALCLAAQWLLFIALKTTNSSVVAPLLGLKIPLLGVLSVILLNERLPWHGWVAILLCATAVFLISPPTGRPAMRGLALIFLVCLGYSGSDLLIPRVVERVSSASDMPILLGFSLTYILCGIGGLAVAVHQGSWRQLCIHKCALPFSICWLLGMCLLFAAFSTIGVIFGNMLQSSRGLMTVLMSLFLVKTGLEQIDLRTGKLVFVLRLAGALLMTGAIVLYYLTKLKEGAP